MYAKGAQNTNLGLCSFYLVLFLSAPFPVLAAGLCPARGPVSPVEGFAAVPVAVYTLPVPGVSRSLA